MFRIVLLVVASLVIVAADQDDSMRKCFKLLHPHSLQCCKKEINKEYDEDMKDCFKKHTRSPSCEEDICLAKKKGFASDDGVIDKTALQAVIEKEFENEPQLINSIKEKCINGNLDAYGPPDFCDLSKLRHCVKAQFVKACPEWDDKGHCNGMSELVEECAKMAP